MRQTSERIFLGTVQKDNPLISVLDSRFRGNDNGVRPISLGMLAGLLIVLAWTPTLAGEEPSASDAPRIRPDYAGVTVPPNIAPMNFQILEPGTHFRAAFSGPNGNRFEVTSGDGEVRIPAKKWKALLEANIGSDLWIDISVQMNAGKKDFARIVNPIAAEPIDPWLAYRFIKPLHNFWKDVEVYQRDLTNFRVSPILRGGRFENGCVNCHSFANNDPATMTLGIRSEIYDSSTLLVRNGAVNKIASKWGYTAIHPSGKMAAYAIMKVHAFFHTAGLEVRDVVDLDSAILYYDFDKRVVKSTPDLKDAQRLETYPAWTPDGKWLYFCSAAIPWTDRTTVPPKNFDQTRYELRRISYDIEKDQWGKAETVLSPEATGKSMLLPRISPDGRLLVFCMCKYGCFPIYQPSSDLFVMDLQTGQYRPMECNSEFSESWHSFSSNGRWLTFSSKRQGGLFTRTYFAYIEPDGKARKPFVLPQKDPAYYEKILQCFSVPELLTGPVTIAEKELAAAVVGTDAIKTPLPFTTATPKAGSPPPGKKPVERE